ncbi:hypothetical protein [Aureispira sp. CCB-QB1]|uniref:hypothetical protein n=1 Tax=Aureispira sp. CCB-QB1 TaxID=1313421 RepID=UPI0006982269|nr:hypothetical protein [Aureispira sp. CCB-QB1]
MANTNIQLQSLISKLESLENDTLLQRVSDFLDGILAASDSKKIEELPPLTQDEIEGVKEALEQAKNGEVYSEEEIKNKFFK